MDLTLTNRLVFGGVSPCVVKKLRVKRVKTDLPNQKRPETTDEYLARVTGNPQWKKALGETRWPLDPKPVHEVSKTAVELYRQTNGAVYFPGFTKPAEGGVKTKPKHKMDISKANQYPKHSLATNCT